MIRIAARLGQLGVAVRALVVLTLVLGVGYPLAMTGVAALVSRANAQGSLVDRDGKVVGSDLIGQSFDGQPGYFQSRPSAAGEGYDPLSTSASNLGASSPDLLAAVRERQTQVAAREKVAVADVPADAVLASGSGLDPQISPAYARLQIARVAAERGLPETEVATLVDKQVQGRPLGFLGSERVNVLLLNLALDRASSTGTASSDLGTAG